MNQGTDTAWGALIAPAARSFKELARVWRLSEPEQKKLLGLSDGSTLEGWRSDSIPEADRETIHRISHLLGIFKAINILVPDEARADLWMRAPNRAPPFNGRSALHRMCDGNIEDLQAVRRYLEAQLG